MTGRRAATAVALMAGLIGGLAKETAAEPPARKVRLSARERQAVAACLDIIRNCQLPDGALVQVNLGVAPGTAVWVPPYFSSYAALALLAEAGQNANNRRAHSDDLDRVGRWLEWCARHQEAEGYWYDWEGTRASYRSNGKVDAWDSSAAMFLLVAGRYQQAGGRVTPEVLRAARLSLGCIEQVTDADGLTWARPDYKVKFLMDNIEVYAELRGAASLLTAARLSDEAKRAAAQADRIAKRLPDYWQPNSGHFAYALHENGAFEAGLEKPYPHGLAQLFGVAFVEPHQAAWTAAGRFPAGNGPLAAAGAERWLVAAARMGRREEQAWRAKLVRDIAAFQPGTVYLYRPAVSVLGLLEGADWMPSPAQED